MQLERPRNAATLAENWIKSRREIYDGFIRGETEGNPVRETSETASGFGKNFWGGRMF
jgi:hypothetical protein